MQRPLAVDESSCVDDASMSWRAYALRVLALMLVMGENASSPLGVAALSVSACLLLLQRAALVGPGLSLDAAVA